MAAAGITAIIAWPKGDAGPQVSDPGQEAGYQPSLGAESTATVRPSPTATVKPNPSPSPTVTQPVTANNGSGRVTLKKPVDGTIINGFSGDELVFFASMNMWATHNGIDISWRSRGAKVVAALSGTVTQIYTSDNEGGVIIISHSDTSQTVYAGLDDISVEAGAEGQRGPRKLAPWE